MENSLSPSFQALLLEQGIALGHVIGSDIIFEKFKYEVVAPTRKYRNGFAAKYSTAGGRLARGVLMNSFAELCDTDLNKVNLPVSKELFTENRRDLMNLVLRRAQIYESGQGDTALRAYHDAIKSGQYPEYRRELEALFEAGYRFYGIVPRFLVNSWYWSYRTKHTDKLLDEFGDTIWVDTEAAKLVRSVPDLNYGYNRSLKATGSETIVKELNSLPETGTQSTVTTFTKNMAERSNLSRRANVQTVNRLHLSESGYKNEVNEKIIPIMSPVKVAGDILGKLSLLEIALRQRGQYKAKEVAEIREKLITLLS